MMICAQGFSSWKITKIFYIVLKYIFVNSQLFSQHLGIKMKVPRYDKVKGAVNVPLTDVYKLIADQLHDTCHMSM